MLSDLKAKYGSSATRRVLVNRAIRAELPGGAAVLDAMQAAHGLNEALLKRYRDSSQCQQSQQVLDLLRTAANAMSDEIATRYGLEPLTD